jgi:hypothetical protein
VGSAERNEALRLIESEDFGVDTDGLQRAADVILGAGVGGILGLAAGGPAAAIPGALAGGVSTLASQEVEKRTGSALAGAGAGLATDLAITAATRRPSAGLLRKMNPSTGVRAGRMLESADLLGRVGPEGATELGETILRRYEALESAEKQAWDLARGSSTGIRVPAGPVKTAAREVLNRTRLRPNTERSQAAQLVFGKDDLGKLNIGDTIGIEDAREILSSISEDLRTAAVNPELARRSVGASDLRKAVNQALDRIESRSPAGSAEVTSLRAARAASAQKHAAVPEKSVLYKSLLGNAAFDQPEKAMQTILGSRQPVQEVKKIKDLIRGDVVAERALKRVAVQRIFGRVAGGTGEIAPRSAGAAAERAGAESRVLREILGDKGYRQIQSINRKLYESTRGKGGKILPEVRVRQSPGGGGVISGEAGAGGVVGAVVGYALGGAQAAATGGLVGATGGLVIQHVAKRLGNNAARALAIEALLDESVMKQVTKKLTSEAVLERSIESFLRQGVLTFADVSDVDVPRDEIRLDPERTSAVAP